MTWDDKTANSTATRVVCNFSSMVSVFGTQAEEDILDKRKTKPSIPGMHLSLLSCECNWNV